ncbi:MAG: hypothetical protein AB1832_00740 [Pseudomonadota bacterium]
MGDLPTALLKGGGMSKEGRYPIAIASLREQARDRYRLWFFSGLVLLCIAVAALIHGITGSGLPIAIAQGAVIGMLPSAVLGQPGCMPLGSGDAVKVEQWFEGKRYLRDSRGWVPAVPRALYFDSQIVSIGDGFVIGPIATLRALRRHLQSGRT